MAKGDREFRLKSAGRYSWWRDAETVLTIIGERGTPGLPLEDVYRMLYNPDLYLRAYARLYQNKGAMDARSKR